MIEQVWRGALTLWGVALLVCTLFEDDKGELREDEEFIGVIAKCAKWYAVGFYLVAILVVTPMYYLVLVLTAR